MRKVLIRHDPPIPADWVVEAEAATTALRTAANREERKAIIEANDGLWRDDRIREWLLKQFHRKCWYSEAMDVVSSCHVDHYRPKGKATKKDEPPQEGYWWLAFQWKNYRICGQLLNVKKRDLFPVVEGPAATADGAISIELEAPVLLDPTTDDASLVSFSRIDDGCIAESSVLEADDPRSALRATRSIEILGLNRLPGLNEKRAKVWDRCSGKILEYRKLNGPSVLVEVQRAMISRDLKSWIAYDQEFSSVAYAAVDKLAPSDLRTRVFRDE